MIINKLDDWFQLLYSETVPPNAFLFKGKPHSVPTVFQIWVRRESRREPIQDHKSHPDFKFVSREKADFALRRVGKYAGRVHDETWRSDKVHYFIQGEVWEIMIELEPAFAEAARNTAGQPSLAKSELTSIYSDWLADHKQTKGAEVMAPKGK